MQRFSVSKLLAFLLLVTLLLPTTSYAQEAKDGEVSKAGLPIHLDPSLSDSEVQQLLASIDEQENEYSKTEEGREYLRKAKVAQNDQKSCSKSGVLATLDTEGQPPWYCVYINSTTYTSGNVTYQYDYVKETPVTYQINNTGINQAFNFTYSTTETWSYTGSLALSKFGSLGVSYNSQQVSTYNNTITVPANTTYWLYKQVNWTHKEGVASDYIRALTNCGWYVWPSASYTFSLESPGVIGWRVSK